MHQSPWYPGTGAAAERGPHGTLWNVPMAPGLAPAIYTEALWRAIDAATADFTPELVFVSAGFDSLAGDPLGDFTWTASDLAAIMRTLIDRARTWCDGRIIATLEGGYAPEATAEAVMAQLHVMVES
jgi:acetoin utilization deacetylase AcuC-like enzyme